ncbi:MAG: flagellar hook protein FlgE [Bryobacterales bacterium]|nr:flagellar hook protein FlgE [Bryobacterales bacterium]
MFKSFSTALSGINANATAVDVVSHNLANINTVGYKGSDVAFRDLMSQSMSPGSNSTQVGFGSGLPMTMRRFTQGTMQQSGGQFDAAIQGDGFFVLRTASGERLFTRAGNFQLDKAGRLVTATGEYVQGYLVDANGVPTGTLTDVTAPARPLLEPKKTTQFTMDLNLNASAPADSKFSVPVEVYDAQGKRSLLTITFTKSSTANTWTAAGTMRDSQGADVNVTLSSTSFTFDADGKLTAPTADIDVTLATTPSTTVKWVITGANITQYSAPSAVSANSQDGSGAAQLVRISMADGGLLVASYSNSQKYVVAQLALAAIRNPETMVAVGDNNLQTTNQTAQAVIGEPGTGGRGKIVGGALEFSNVDLAREFTNLIAYQRGYQASSKVITTVDELTQDTINLKR